MTMLAPSRLPEHLAARQRARRGERVTQVVAGSLALACFVGAAFTLTPINKTRLDRQFVVDSRSIAGLPPEIALLGKLGTFRALAIDWAAIRAERLKEEGKDYEALQLHQAVCALAPRFPRVWVYAAWNMAYNISVSQYTPEARWQWVRNGISILRDQGIVYNPRSVSIYKELAWIYWHKIGDFLDDEHMNYKRALAVEMESILGPPPPAPTTEESLAEFRKIVDAPGDPAVLVRQDPNVARFVEELRGVELAPDRDLLDLIARHLRSELRARDISEGGEPLDSILERRLGLLKAEQWAGPRDRLVASVRRHTLLAQQRLDVDRMYALMAERYGPLDWRNAFAHALYWSALGDELGKAHSRTDAADAMNTARLVLASLQNLVAKGRLTLYPDFDQPFDSYVDFSPDTRFIPILFAETLRLGREQFGDDPNFREGTPGRQFLTGFVTNIHQWIQLLFVEGGESNIAQAENLFAWLRKNNPHPDGTMQERYKVTLEQFVMDEIIAAMNTWRAASSIIRGFVQRAFKEIALGRLKQGENSLRMAVNCYDIWMQDTTRDFNDRRKLSPPRIILRDEIYAFMENRAVDPLFKARLWRNLPLEQRRMTFDRLKPVFDRLCAEQSPPWSPSKAFLEPPDMDEYRRTAELPTVEPDSGGKVEQGTRYRD